MRRSIPSSVACLLLGMALCASMAPAQQERAGCAAEKYALIAVPMRPTSISENGIVAGTTGDHRAAFWSVPRDLKKIELPPGFHHAEGVAGDNQGEVLLTASSADGSRRQSFVYAEGKLMALPGLHSIGNAMNASGEVVGESLLPGKAGSGPTFWKNGAPLDLGACCGGSASAVNSRGQAAGQVYDKQGRYQAFVWDAEHGMKMIGPEEGYSSAVAINDAGHVLIEAFTQGAFLYRDGVLTKLELSKQWPSHPKALSDCDVVVGTFGSNADESRAFVWDAQHGFRDLNLLVPQLSGWKLEGAASINGRGEIVGWGDHQGDDAGFLLVPAKQ